MFTLANSKSDTPSKVHPTQYIVIPNEPLIKRTIPFMPKDKDRQIAKKPN